MDQLPLAIELERREPQRNMYRYYRLELERDLLGAVIARRSWGRIGTRGQTKVSAFATDREAQAELLLWERRKRQRGYVDHGSCRSPAATPNAEIISA